MTSFILIVKKHRLIADYWLKTFSEAGYRAHICNINEEDVLQAVRTQLPDVLFIEASFAENKGFELVRQAKQIHPALRCLVCLPTIPFYYAAAIQIDASGYLPDDIEEPEEVFKCLKIVLQGYRYISPVFHRVLYLPTRQDSRHIDSLTEKQRQILRFVADGQTSKQIAHQLGISQSTVQNHKEHISKLVGLKGVYQLKIFAGSVAQFL